MESRKWRLIPDSARINIVPRYRDCSALTTNTYLLEPSNRSHMMAAPTGDAVEAVLYLDGMLNKTLHIHITDGRMFVGQMKCTDNERNIILAMTHEYRQPSPTDVKLAAERHERAGRSGNVRVDMKKRFVGLIVIPGQWITRMEVEG